MCKAASVHSSVTYSASRRPQDPAGRRVHQVHPRTRWARHRLVDLTLIRRAVVSEPTLYVEPGVGAAVEHGGHVAA
jgi:hypothetical protein